MKHRIEPLQKIRSTRRFDDGPNATDAALRAPSQEADASFRFRRYLLPPERKKESSFAHEKERRRLFPFDPERRWLTVVKGKGLLELSPEQDALAFGVDGFIAVAMTAAGWLGGYLKSSSR